MTASEKLELSVYDPLLREIELPLRAAVHPLGFSLHLATNSRDVIQAAQEAWNAYGPAYARQPLEIRMIVQAEGALADEPPVFRSQGNLFSVVYDRHNFGVCESTSLEGYCFISRKTASDHVRLRLHFLEAMTYMLLAQRHAVPLHAAAVARGGAGFLLCGPSGAGKSSLAYACARAGWTFVSDDATWLPAHAGGRTAVGRPRHARFREDAPRLFPELARYAAGQRPNGKITIEAPIADFPTLRTGVHCTADHLILLDRRPCAPRLIPLSTAEVIAGLLADMPAYGERVRELYERTLGRLTGASAWRLEYETLEQGLKLLAEIETR